ncbi:MAG: PKD domain-containing protein, partial [Bacteroidota bacterium]|nr:PKD domain-containing protein [Bacteroidota bacterium]MDX5430761.1 PKD domain-containing protein [Bacteroidota bacterium]MDX5469506.1 PKD domain-containing protein [Bacteroidota bacterium]
LSYLWDFGDGTSSTQANPSKTFAVFGSKTITLIASSGTGCSDTASMNVQVYADPVASFAVNDTSQCFEGHFFSFQNNSTIGADTMSYVWNFGDGSSATTTHATKTYASPTTYDVSLLVTSTRGCDDTLVKTMYVYANPQAVPTVSDSIQCGNDQNFAFYDSSAYPEGYLSRTWNFGNGTTDTSINPAIAYSAPGYYPVKLVARSSNGCADSSTFNMRVHIVPVANFGINKSSMCLNADTFRFINTSSIVTGSISYSWLFGDGTSDTIRHAKKAYAADSTWYPMLLAISNNGCIDTAMDTVIVYPLPVSDFVVNADSQCVNLQDFQFNEQVQLKSGTIARYSWYLGNYYRDGDGDTATYFPYAGHQLIRLAVVSDQGCVDTSEKTIRVYEAPVSDFTTNDSIQCEATNQFDFVPLSTGDTPLSYTWIFYPGDTSVLMNPSRSFPMHDTIPIQLITSSVYGCLDTITENIIVLPQPHANFAVNDSTQCLDGNVFVFSNQTTLDFGTPSLSWYFDPLPPSTAQTASRTYLAHGTYQVKLIASHLGCQDSMIKDMVVYPMPTMDFTINDPNQCVNNHQFDFTTGSSITSGTIRLFWNMGDGFIDSLTNTISHGYVNAGNYLVTHGARSDQGCYRSISKGITVFPKPQASFTVNDSTQCVNAQNFTFASSSVALGGYQIVDFDWTADNGATGGTPFFSPSFADPGQFGIQLIVTTDSGCSDTAISSVRVFPRPNVSFTINDTAQCLNTNDFHFESTSFDSLGILSQRWFEGNKLYNIGPDLDFTFKDTGIHRIRLRVTSNEQCWDTL